jgi:hypothetical protein
MFRPLRGPHPIGGPGKPYHRHNLPASAKIARGSAVQKAVRRCMKKQRYNVKAGKNKAPAQAKARPDVWSSYVRSGDGLRKAGTSDDTFTAAINGLLTSNLNPGPGVRRARPPKYDCIDGDQSGSDDSSTERQLPSHGRPRGRSGTKRKRQRRNTKSARGSGIGESAAFSGGEFSSDSAGESGNSSSGEEEYIVKAILGHREEEGERQYYVEWAGGSHTWEPDTYIADTALFQDYLSRLAECTVLRRKTAGRALVYAGCMMLQASRPAAPENDRVVVAQLRLPNTALCGLGALNHGRRRALAPGLYQRRAHLKRSCPSTLNRGTPTLSDDIFGL